MYDVTIIHGWAAKLVFKLSIDLDLFIEISIIDLYINDREKHFFWKSLIEFDMDMLWLHLRQYLLLSC